MPSRPPLSFLYSSPITGAFLFKKYERQTCILKVKRKGVCTTFVNAVILSINLRRHAVIAGPVRTALSVRRVLSSCRIKQHPLPPTSFNFVQKCLFRLTVRTTLLARANSFAGRHLHPFWTLCKWPFVTQSTFAGWSELGPPNKVKNLLN